MAGYIIPLVVLICFVWLMYLSGSSLLMIASLPTAVIMYGAVILRNISKKKRNDR